MLVLLVMVNVCSIVFVELFIVILSVNVLLIVLWVMILCGFKLFLIFLINLKVVWWIILCCWLLIVSVVLLYGNVRFKIFIK